MNNLNHIIIYINRIILSSIIIHNKYIHTKYNIILFYFLFYNKYDINIFLIIYNYNINLYLINIIIIFN